MQFLQCTWFFLVSGLHLSLNLYIAIVFPTTSLLLVGSFRGGGEPYHLLPAHVRQDAGRRQAGVADVVRHQGGVALLHHAADRQEVVRLGAGGQRLDRGELA